MFYSATMQLKALNNAVINRFIGKKVHGWFFKVMKEADKEISTALHSNISDKAFTVSSFIGHNVSKPIQIEEGKIYTIRITLLMDYLFDIFTSKIFETKMLEESLEIEDAKFSVHSFSVGDINKWSGYISEEQLFKMDNTSKTVTMKFFTPTCFRIGDLHLREPDPDKVFTSLLNKFNKYSNIKFDEGIKEKFKEIEIVHKDTIQKKVYFPNFYIQGFVGTVTYKLPEKPALIEAVNVLSRFAFYSGVGYKTTMGLGQAKRIEEES